MVLAAVDLGLAHGGGGFDVHDHRVLQVDQVVVGIGVDGRPAAGGGPARRRIGGRDELRLDRRRAAEGRVVEHGQILVDRPVGGRLQSSRVAGHAALTVGVGGDQAGVDREALAAHQALGHAARDNGLEQLAQQIAVAEAAVAVLGEGRVVRHVAVEAQPAEPAIGQVEVDLLAQPPLGADAEAIAHQQHPDHQLRDRSRDVRSGCRRSEDAPARPPDRRTGRSPEAGGPGHMPLERELVEQRPLIDLAITHHGLRSRPREE